MNWPISDRLLEISILWRIVIDTGSAPSITSRYLKLSVLADIRTELAKPRPQSGKKLDIKVTVTQL
jgi:hypothetical protein